MDLNQMNIEVGGSYGLNFQRIGLEESIQSEMAHYHDARTKYCLHANEP